MRCERETIEDLWRRVQVDKGVFPEFFEVVQYRFIPVEGLAAQTFFQPRRGEGELLEGVFRRRFRVAFVQYFRGEEARGELVKSRELGVEVVGAVAEGHALHQRRPGELFRRAVEEVRVFRDVAFGDEFQLHRVG